MRRLALLVALLLALPALAHDSNGHANWIARGRYLSPIDGSHCCGEQDCFELPAADVRVVPGGWRLRSGEFVPAREGQASRDGAYWRCMKPDGSRRCFFVPPSTN